MRDARDQPRGRLAGRQKVGSPAAERGILTYGGVSFPERAQKARRAGSRGGRGLAGGKLRLHQRGAIPEQFVQRFQVHHPGVS